MHREHRADRPHGFYCERALVGHTLLVAQAICDARPAVRSAAQTLPRSTWRSALRKVTAATGALRQRRELRRTAQLAASGELERLEIEARAMRAAAGSGFGSAEAANDGNYFSAA